MYNPTKHDMALIIAQALFVLPKLPPDNNWKVRQLARGKKEDLIPLYNLALSNMLTESWKKALANKQARALSSTS